MNLHRPRHSAGRSRTRRLAELSLALAAGLIAPALAHAEGDKPFLPEETLRVCSDPNNPPFSSKDESGLENALAKMLAEALGLKLEYTWFPQRMGFIRNTLKKWNDEEKRFQCDLVMSVPEGFDQVATTAPYYRSTYALVYESSGKLEGMDPEKPLVDLSEETKVALKLGIFVPSPGVDWLQRRGLFSTAKAYNMLSGDPDHYPGKLLENEVAKGELDGVILWGPIGGYFAGTVNERLAEEKTGRSLKVALLSDEPGIKLEFGIAMGVRRGDKAWKSKLEETLAANADKVAALLAEYHIPVTSEVASAELPRDRDYIVASNEDSNELSVIDAKSQAVIKTFDVGRRPRGMKASADGECVFVALSGSPKCPPSITEEECEAKETDKSADGIAMVDWRSGEILKVLPGGSDPEQFDLSGPTCETSRLFIANEDDGKLSVVDVAKGEVIAEVEVGEEPEGVRVTPDGKRVAVTSESDSSVAVIDTESFELLGKVEVGRRPRDIVFSHDGKLMYVSAEANARVDVVDMKTLKPIDPIKMPDVSLPMGLALSPKGDRLYVTTGRGRMAVVVQLSDKKILKSIQVGVRPWGVALSSDGSRLYTANGPSNTVSIVDTEALEVINRPEVGRSPWDVVVIPASTSKPTAMSH